MELTYRIESLMNTIAIYGSGIDYSSPLVFDVGKRLNSSVVYEDELKPYASSSYVVPKLRSGGQS